MRGDRVQRMMTREEINGILIFDPFNIRYLTGYKPACIAGSSIAVLAPDIDPWLIVPQEEYELAKANSWFRNVLSYSSEVKEGIQSAFLGCIHDAIEQHNLHAADIGVELDFVSARRFEAVKRLLPDAGFKNITMPMNELRMVKDEVEIEKIQSAIQIAENGLLAALEFIQPGISEIEVAAEVERTLRRAGATNTGYPTVIASGNRASCPYAPASRREIVANELVVISISAVNDDYCSNITRTIITGKPNKKQQALFNCALDAVSAAQNQLNPESLIRDIALSIQRIAEDRGYLEVLIQQMGNGVGLQPHEPPQVSTFNETPILPGMVFTIEAGLYDSSVGCIRLGNMILCQKDGVYAILNQIALDLI
jgi:Xaa-Pro aminopeptidase